MTHKNDKLLEKLFSGSDMTADEKQALSAEDLECADLLEVIADVDDAVEPPAHLDSAILAHAHSVHTASKRPMVVYFRLALTAAAALLFTLIVIQLLPVKTDEPVNIVNKKPGEESVIPPDRSKVVKNKISPTLAENDSIPEFDWEADSITKEMALLEAEIYMDALDYADAALVENFE